VSCAGEAVASHAAVPPAIATAHVAATTLLRTLKRLRIALALINLSPYPPR
jgi:hypothetical protein